MRLDARCILLKEEDYGFLLLQMIFFSDTREVFYIQNLENVPSTGRASISTSGESSCNIVECMLDLSVPWWACNSLHHLARESWICLAHERNIPRQLLDVSLIDQPFDLFLDLVTTFDMVLFDSVELIYLAEEVLHMASELEAYGCCTSEEPRAKSVHDERSEAWSSLSPYLIF